MDGAEDARTSRSASARLTHSTRGPIQSIGPREGGT